MGVTELNYAGNALADIEYAINEGKRGITLDRGQMLQILELNHRVVEAKNEVVRELLASRSQNAVQQAANVAQPA